MSGFAPAGLESMPTAVSGSASASTPVGAALLIGLGMPARFQERVRWIVIHIEPRQDVSEDGTLAWTWEAPGVRIYVSVDREGVSEATFRIDEQPPATVDGEVLRREIA